MEISSDRVANGISSTLFSLENDTSQSDQPNCFAVSMIPDSLLNQEKISISKDHFSTFHAVDTLYLQVNCSCTQRHKCPWNILSRFSGSSGEFCRIYLHAQRMFTSFEIKLSRFAII